MASLVITVKSNLSQSELKERFQKASGEPKAEIRALEQLLKRIGLGIDTANIDVTTASGAPVAASNTFTLASVVAGNSVSIDGVTLTFTSTPATEDDVEVDGATDADDATALAAAVNAHSVLGKLVNATSASNVVTVRANQKGIIGNQIGLNKSGATITIGSGSALENGAGGTEEAPVNYTFGLAAS